MKSHDKASIFYSEVIKSINLNDFLGAIKIIRQGLFTLNNHDDTALALLYAGFLYHKLGDYHSAITNFSNSISIESELDMLSYRSKDISFHARSNSRYHVSDYKGSIEDRRTAKKLRLLEVQKSHSLGSSKIDYKDLQLKHFNRTDLDPKYLALVKLSKVKRSKYDLIEDYRKVINKKKKQDLILKLETLSEHKYNNGDFKGSIKAIRRADKYYY